MSTRVKYDRDFERITNYYLEAARGTINQTSVVHKFGYAEDIDDADGVVDIWDGVASDIGGKINPYNWIDDVPVTLQLSSSSSADTDMPFSIQGLDENWNLQTVIANTDAADGQTPVTVTGYQWRRVFRVFNAGGVDMVGNLFVSDNLEPTTAGRPNDSTTVRAIVHAHAQQTQMALYTVPAGFDMYITHGWANISKAISTTSATVTIYRRTEGGVFRIVHTLSLHTTGSTGDHRPYTIPIKWNEKEDIIYRVDANANGTSVSAGFHAVLIGNTNYP